MVTPAPSAPALPPPAERRRVRRLFLALLVVLPAQFGLTHACEALFGVQMWPGLVFPSFGRVYDVGGGIVVREPVVTATFADGSRAAVAVRDLLADLPVSHHRIVMQRTFPFDGPAPIPAEKRAWLAARLRALHPDRTPTALEVRWAETTYRRSGDALRPDSAQTLAILQIPL